MKLSELEEKLNKVYDRRLAMVENVKYKTTMNQQWTWIGEYMELIREEIQLRYGKLRELGR